MSRLIIIVVVYDYQFLNDCKQLIMILSSLHIVPGKEYLINKLHIKTYTTHISLSHILKSSHIYHHQFLSKKSTITKKNRMIRKHDKTIPLMNMGSL